ncbi:MAG: helix-turn-helix domain-containing protein [Prevotella sp.]|nr:helix-turn-helix domain-containing protein [Prevotella sp.]
MRELLLICLLCVSQALTARPECHIEHFEELTEKTLRVTRIVQDRQGFMWIGTLNGLYRYDGYNFVSFKAKAGDGSHIITDHVSSIYLDANNNIWCLIGRRACLFDTRTMQFTDVLRQMEQQTGRTYDVKKIRTMRDGTTWLITSDGLYISLRNDRPVSTAAVRLRGLADQDRMFATDHHGRTWILTNRGTFMFNGKQIRKPQTYSTFVNRGNNSWLLDDNGRLHVLTPDDRIVPVTNPLPTEPIAKIYPLLNNRVALITATRLLMMDARSGRIIDSGIRGQIAKLFQYVPRQLWLQMTDGTIIRLNGDNGAKMTLAGLSSPLSFITEDPNHNVWMLADNGSLYCLNKGTTMPQRYPTEDENLKKSTNSLTDRQGNIWFRNDAGICKLSFRQQHLQPLQQEVTSMIRSSMVDGKGRYWVSGYDDNTLRVFDRHNRPVGYLGPDGRLHAAYTVFGSHFYCMLQDHSGQIWLGSKPDGLFRLRETAPGTFLIAHWKPAPGRADLTSGEIYGMVQDRQGRLWIATHGGGLLCIKDTRAGKPVFLSRRNTPALNLSVANLNVLTITHDDRLLCGSENGIFITDLRTQDIRRLKFRHHTRESDRANSLSSSHITGILEDQHHRIFISTECGGISRIMSDDLLADRLAFRHYNMDTGFLSDVSQAIFEHNGRKWVLALNQLIEMDHECTKRHGYNSFFKRDKLSFSPCRPLRLPDGRWLLGTANGAFIVRLDNLGHISNVPQIALTGLKVQGQEERYDVNGSDTIVIRPRERSFMLSFAALDYSGTDMIDYAYQIGDNQKAWTYIGRSHSISFPDINPGTYAVRIRSTNGEGTWVGNTRRVVIIVKPTFWETPWATLLYVILLAGILFGIIHTITYIRTIKQQQRDALDKYLKLLDSNRQEAGNQPRQAEIIRQARQKAADDNFMKRLMSFIEQNMSNSDLTVEDMAEALATSQSGLNRKLKDLLGSTPSDLLKKARIEYACVLLKKDTGMNIAEVAFNCGFADPKYFSKCFKASKGMKPSDYRTDA